MNNRNIILALVIFILLLLGGGFWYIQGLKNTIKEEQLALRTEKLKNDKLEKINDNQYRKLVADTLKQRDLNRIIDSLGIELDAKPKIVYRTKIVVKEVEKPIDSVEIENDTLKVDDYYPQKENYFIRYQNIIDLINGKGNSKWSFNPVNISIALSQREDGIWQSDISVPPYMEVGEVDVQATPLELPERDDFGWIIGAGIGKDLRADGEDYLRLTTGIRYKRFYIDVGGGTNSTVDGSIKYEF